MAIQITARQAREEFSDIIAVPYCDLQTLLRYENKRFYTSGVYGWNSSIYTSDEWQGVAISTGYRPIGNISSREVVRKYEGKAKRLENDKRYSYEGRKKSNEKATKCLYR